MVRKNSVRTNLKTGGLISPDGSAADAPRFLLQLLDAQRGVVRATLSHAAGRIAYRTVALVKDGLGGYFVEFRPDPTASAIIVRPSRSAGRFLGTSRRFLLLLKCRPCSAA